MAVNDNTFFQYDENRALSGYKSAWLVKMPGANFYSLVGGTSSVPYVFGDKETFEFDILQSATKGQVEGKMALEPQDIEVLHHRDNAYRYEGLKGKTLDFMTINAEYVGYKFSGTVDYRPNNAEADANMATVTITPVSASATPIYNARPLIRETLYWAQSIPRTIKSGETVDLAVKQTVGEGGLTITAKKIADTTNVETDATLSTDYSVSGSVVTLITPGLYALTASAEGYAPWTTTVYVESAAAAS